MTTKKSLQQHGHELFDEHAYLRELGQELR